MPSQARTFVLSVIFLGLAVSVFGTATSGIVHPLQFSILLAAAAVAGATKVPLPGITGTYSLHFVCILLGIRGLSLIELIAIAAAGTFVQCVWRAARRPTALQIAFNIAAVILSAAAARAVYRFTTTGMHDQEIGAAVFAAAIYWVLNTGSVSVVLTLINEGNFADLWATWSMWSLPYFVASAALTIPIGDWLYRGQWGPASLLTSGIVLITVCFRVCVHRFGVPRSLQAFAGRAR